MTMLWAWESAAPLAAGCGLSDDWRRALRAASQWMRQHGADRAVLEEVMLLSEDAITPLYLPIGSLRALEAYRDQLGRVRWRARQLAAA